MQQIQITEAASNQIKKIANESLEKVVGVRVGVQGGGCAGLSG